jgi:hypothetical protein
MGVLKPRFLTTGRNSQNGGWGYLQKLIPNMGTATVASGDTSVTVTDALAKTGDLILSGVLTKGTNAAYVVGSSISNGVSFTISVNTDPGSGGAVLWYIRVPIAFLFTS